MRDGCGKNSEFWRNHLLSFVALCANCTMLSDSLIPESNGCVSQIDHEEVPEDQEQLWKDIFPFEIIFLRKILTNKCAFFASSLFYTICTVSLCVYILILISENDYIDPGEKPIIVLFLLHFEGAIMILLPFAGNFFVKKVILNSDLSSLITHAVQHDPLIRLKFAVVTHFHFFCLCMATFLYAFQSDIRHVLFVLFTGIAYFGVANVAVSLAVCTVELHRIKIQQFRVEVNARRTGLDDIFWGESTLLRAEEVNDRGTNFLDKNCNTLQELRKQYYQIYALCCRSSLSYGLYFLFFIVFGLLNTFTTILSIYLGDYPTMGLVGFVFLGILATLGLGGGITACNETGRVQLSACCFVFSFRPTISSAQDIWCAAICPAT